MADNFLIKKHNSEPYYGIWCYDDNDGPDITGFFLSSIEVCYALNMNSCELENFLKLINGFIHYNSLVFFNEKENAQHLCELCKVYIVIKRLTK
ncbi:MAG: hypothetical protein ACOCP8_06300 [archaeon]